MAVLSAYNLKMGFGGRTLFEGASFDIGNNDRVGLIGANGCGKTTIFKLITGELLPVSGEIHCGRDTVPGYMEQHACAGSKRSVREELLTVFSRLEDIEKRLDALNSQIDIGGEGIDDLISEQLILHDEYERHGGLTFRSRARSCLIGLGFSEEMHSLSCDKLSGGQRSKLSLAKLLLSESDFLLLDEPTNHLDIKSLEWLEDFLNDFSGAALIISHDRYFLDRVTNKTLEIDNKKVKMRQGNYSRSADLKIKERESERRQYENTMAEIHRIEGIIAQQRQWNKERNIRTAEHKQKSIDRLSEGLVKPDAPEEKIHFDFKPLVESGNDVLMCEGLSKSFGGKQLFCNADIFIQKNERRFLLGSNGCGKTTLLRILTGEYTADSGKRRFGAGVNIGYFDQSLEGLHPEKTVLDEVWDSYRRLSQTQVRSALAAFLFRGEDVFAKIGDLSGGEKARVALLKLMLGGANFLLLDEPTNHLDINSREALEQALLGYDGTMLIVSHDRYFINKLATSIMSLNADGIVSYDGGYDEYIAAISTQLTETVKKDEKKPDKYRQRREAESEARKRVTRLKKVETLIEETELKIEEKQLELAKPEVAANYESVLSLTEELDRMKTELDEMYAEWETLQ